MRVLLVLCLALACATPVRADPPQPGAMPDWLGGAWLMCAEGREVSEVWSGAGSGLLVGVGFTRSAGRPRFEFMRIAPGARGVSFFASPDGAAPTEFPMTALTDTRVVFENPAHDFPQRVIYTRDGADLTARIEGVVNGKTDAMQWRFKPSAAGARCPAQP